MALIDTGFLMVIALTMIFHVEQDAGKFLGALIALLGIGLFALPAGILGSGFFGALRL